MAASPYRVGIIGYGSIGQGLAQFILGDPRFDIAFLHNRTVSAIPAELSEHVATTLEDDKVATADLIVEAAHPDYTTNYAQKFLTHSDYLPVSTSALVDDELYAGLLQTAEQHGHTLLLPHGALVGLNSLINEKDTWASMSITFRKAPDSLETSDGASESGRNLTEPTTLYQGTVRGIATLYPRNVNSMITLALATLGLDETQATLVADPHESRGILEIQAEGTDGSQLSIRRAQPMKGVSGTEMFGSILGSVMTAAGVRAPGIHFI